MYEGRQMQKLWVHTRRNMLEPAMEQFIENIRVFLLKCVGAEVKCGQCGETIHLVQVPLTSDR